MALTEKARKTVDDFLLDAKCHVGDELYANLTVGIESYSGSYNLDDIYVSVWLEGQPDATTLPKAYENMIAADMESESRTRLGIFRLDYLIQLAPHYDRVEYAR